VLERDFSESKRLCVAVAIKGLYEVNDSNLFGNFTPSDRKQQWRLD